MHELHEVVIFTYEVTSRQFNVGATSVLAFCSALTIHSRHSRSLSTNVDLVVYPSRQWMAVILGQFPFEHGGRYANLLQGTG